MKDLYDLRVSITTISTITESYSALEAPAAVESFVWRDAIHSTENSWLKPFYQGVMDVHEKGQCQSRVGT